MKKDKFVNIFKKYFPYAVIVIASILSCFVYLCNGVAGGDDIGFHLGMVNDLIYGFDHGYFGYSTNHLFIGGFAIYNYAYYGPVTHYGAAIFTYLFRWMGATPSDGLKFMIFASAILGGIYMYKLALKMSNGRPAIAVICSIIFLLLPYRIFCALARCAYAESIAMSLIPMVFYGVYSFIHDKEYRVEPYVVFASGAILIVLSHPFTALITVIFGVLYVLFNIKGVIAKIRDKRALISLGSAIIIIIFCVLFYVLNSHHYESSGIYNISDAERQWTTYEFISNDTSRSFQFSGFINYIYINGNQGNPVWAKDTISTLIFSTIVYVISMVIAILIDKLLTSLKYSKYYKHPAACIAAFAFPLIFQVRVEIYLAILISLILYFFISFLVNKLPDSTEQYVPLYKSVDLYFLIVASIITLALIFVPWAWKLVPPIMYNGQFPWRMYSMLSFLIAMLASLIFSHLKTNKIALTITSVIACGLMTMTMGTLEKRVIFEHNPTAIITQDGEQFAKGIKYSGAQNEMMPQVFYEDGYTVAYTNSLYSTVRSRVLSQRNFIYDLDSYIKPAVLEGTGDVDIYEYNTPNNKFHVNITSETALVQFPQFYYDTYEVKQDGKTISKVQNVDGLIAFTLKKGTYDIALSFKPCKAYQITIPLFYIGAFLLASGGVFGYIYRKKIMKPDTAIEE